MKGIDFGKIAEGIGELVEFAEALGGGGGHDFAMPLARVTGAELGAWLKEAIDETPAIAKRLGESAPAGVTYEVDTAAGEFFVKHLVPEATYSLTMEDVVRLRTMCRSLHIRGRSSLMLPQFGGFDPGAPALA